LSRNPVEHVSESGEVRLCGAIDGLPGASAPGLAGSGSSLGEIAGRALMGGTHLAQRPFERGSGLGSRPLKSVQECRFGGC
jgi:hypothetical protein